jgi:spermidine/putrescine-binding protein
MSDGLTRRQLLKLAAAAAAAPLLSTLEACSSGSSERVVNFFNWSKYIAPDTLARFTRQTGIKVNYEELADEEEMFAKLRSGARGYDLICGTDYMLPRLRGLNVVDPFPPGVLKNLGNIDPKFRGTPYDPDDAFTVPYLWGTTGIAYNKAKVTKPPASWRDLWDERYGGRISMLDNSRDCVSMGLILLGYPETTTDEKAFEKVKDLLIQQRPLVKQYSSATYIDGLVAGELHLAMAWSGDVLQAAHENPQIDYVIPKEGSYMWVDNLCLMRGSRHREDTLQLVDYLLQPEIGAEIANFVRYPTPNAAAKKKLDRALLEDPRVFPSKDVLKRLRFHELLDPETSQMWNEVWQDVKVG